MENHDLKEKIRNRIKMGPETKQPKKRKKQKKPRVPKSKERRSETSDDLNSADPKAFLQAEYGCQCQICKTKIRLINGKNWINVFRLIKMAEDPWYSNEPYNFLGLCPNCYAKASHGGHDFNPIKSAADEWALGNLFPIEIDDLKGDYYQITVELNGKDAKLAMSENHIRAFEAWFRP